MFDEFNPRHENIQIGFVFSPFKWRVHFQHLKDWKQISIELGCLMLTIGY